MSAPMMRIDHTVDSRPIENPARIVVAAPVCDAAATSCTGLRSVEVKYSVRTWMTAARIRPNDTAMPGFQDFMYMSESTSTAAAEMTAERKKPRLMAFIPPSVSLRGDTARIPMIEVT